MEAIAPDRDEVRQASLRLPDRQRAALELREGRGFSYEQIAASLGTSTGSVAQLIERARINLYDELYGTVLASIAAPSAECERALPLIAARQDGELASSSEDASWLDTHLSGCNRCQLAAEQMGEATGFYRGEAAVSAAAVAVAVPATGSSAPAARSRRGHRLSRRRMALAGSLAALALGGVLAALVADSGSPDPAPSAADAAARQNTAQAISGARVVRVGHDAKTARHATKRGARAAAAATSQTGSGDFSSTPIYPLPEAPGTGSQSTPVSSPHGSGNDAAVQPAKQKATPEPKPKPPPNSAQTSQPTTPPAETTPSSPPAEEPTSSPEPTPEHGHKGEPPGKQKQPPGKS